MPTPTDTYVPVVDVSTHQGTVDFTTMRNRGVQGLIIRTNHAQVIDPRCRDYVINARLAGWTDDQLGAYTFANPKRATGEASGKAFVDTVRAVFGHTDLLLMLDIEGYERESGAGPVLKGPLFAAWIRDHIDTVRRLAPDARLIAYSNASFWNTWVGDQQLAAELEWIVPRYPAYSALAYQRNPLPSTPAGWAEWAWRVGPKGPIPPSGVAWQGWQMSAGFNGQGARYGCQSSDLDLNIVEQSAWLRWTRNEPVPPPVPSPPIGEPMKPYLFELPGGGVGVRDTTGSRSINAEEIAEGGPYVSEKVWKVPPGSNWEAWIRAELAKYERELDPPVAAGPVGEQTVHVKVDVTGPN